jgi:UDP-N-acetylmuramate--alanine ligase
MRKNVHFLGVKGVGMTSLALAMQEAGWRVSGSDTGEVFITDEVLRAHQISITPLSSALPTDIDLLIHSTAYMPPQTTIKTQTLADALADFVKDRRVIAVAGVGGKTTTSAMLAALFQAAGRDVGYYVGASTIAGLPKSGHNGTDPYYIVEADEYAISKTDPRPKFALLTPEIVITTNIVHDHPDIYKDITATLDAFKTLIRNIPQNGTWIYNAADPLSQKILSEETLTCKCLSYDLTTNNLQLSVFGDQNYLDAQAAVLVATTAGLTLQQAIDAIKAYKGAGRRQEFHGEVEHRLLYDDYGHHPGEIKITVESFKKHFPNKRILLVFESHTYTRTESLLSEFAEAIASADQAFIMPIFESAREKGQAHSVTTKSFAQLIPGALALNWENAAELVWQKSLPGDIILTMGAGFVYKLHEEFKKNV